MARRYAILIATVSAWLAFLIMVWLPIMGVTAPVSSPRPTYSYELIGLLVTACVAAAYSMYLGIKHLFPEIGY